MVGAIAAHGYLATLGWLGLLNFTVNTKYPPIAVVANSDLWAWIHTIAALVLVGGLVHRPYWKPAWRGHVSEIPLAAIACSVGFSAMATWAFFNMLWGVTTTRPVSLAGPGLAFVVAAGEQLLANAWTRGTHDKGR